MWFYVSRIPNIPLQGEEENFINLFGLFLNKLLASYEGYLDPFFALGYS